MIPGKKMILQRLTLTALAFHLAIKFEVFRLLKTLGILVGFIDKQNRQKEIILGK